MCTIKSLMGWLLRLGILILGGISGVLLLWGFWPPPRQEQLIPLAVAEHEPLQPVARLVVRPTMRVGDSQIVEFHAAGRSESGSLEGVILSTRLDLSPMEVRPSGEVSSTITEGRGASFYWEVTPWQAGEVRGTLWVYLQLRPDAAGGRRVIAAPLVVIRSVTLWGWTGRQARLWGVFGMALAIGMAVLGQRWVRICV